MKKTIFIFFLFCLFFSCSHKVYYSLNWQSDKVMADGKIPEWDNPLRFYDDKSKINYTISNDRENLYLCLKISDETSQMKIIRGGMEFRIDIGGEKLFPVALIFPMRNMEDRTREPKTERKEGEAYDHSAMKKKRLSEIKFMQLIGFKLPFTGVIPLDNTLGISAAINIDETGIMFYEAVIPFKAFYKNELTSVDTNRVFNYEIKVNGIPAPPMKEGGGGSGMSGGGGRGSSGMGAGTMGGGGYGATGGYQGRSEIFTTNEITRKLKLAYK